MSDIEITLTDLTFPENLNDKYCKFRPVISVKYKDSNNKTTYAREALPGLGPRDYWECEKDNKKKDNWVRHTSLPKVDMEKVDVMKREIVFNDLDISRLQRVEVEIFDIDIKSGFEKMMSKALEMLPAGAMTALTPGLPLTLTLVKKAVEKGTGKSVRDLEAGLMSKLIGKEDGSARSIWARSMNLDDPVPDELVISGSGEKGDFSVTLEMSVD